MFGEKCLGKCTMYIGIAITPDFVVLLFIFTFNTFGKNYLNSKLQVVKDD